MIGLGVQCSQWAACGTRCASVEEHQPAHREWLRMQEWDLLAPLLGLEWQDGLAGVRFAIRD